MEVLEGLHDKIILKPIEQREQFVGGIVVPDAGRERSNFFEIVHVGPGKFNEFTNQLIPMQLKVGDKVVVPKAIARQVMLDGEEYYITREVEVEAILREKDGQ